jgi:hypothetical protein
MAQQEKNAGKRQRRKAAEPQPSLPSGNKPQNAKGAEKEKREATFALQSSNLLSGCEDFSDSPGVRPSSGAASQ